MAKTKRALLFLTFLVSCTAVVLAIVSVATENWVVGEVVISNKIDPNARVSNVNYGLFTGTFEEYLLDTPHVQRMTTVCLMSENICMLSIQESAEARDNEIQAFFNDNCPNSRNLGKTVHGSNNIAHILKSNGTFVIKQADSITLDSPVSINETNRNKSRLGLLKNDEACNKYFLNAGLWVTTILFLAFSLCMGMVAAAFTVANSATNPTSQWTSIWGLYVWNSVAAVGYVLTLILWGAQFGQHVTEDVAITDTLNGSYENNDNTFLGYSYWLIIGSLILHIANVGILFLRQYLIRRQPKIPTIKQDMDKDGMIFVY